MALVEVRLTIRPGTPVRVDEAEVPHLRHQGLLAAEPVPVKPPRHRTRSRSPQNGIPAAPAYGEAAPDTEGNTQ